MLVIKSGSSSFMVVAIVDYGAGNVQSVVNACDRIGHRPVVVSDGKQLVSSSPSHIILPGVGAVGASLQKLRKRHLDSAMSELVLSHGAYFLGICVGMQVMAKTCFEFGQHEGLGWLPGVVDRVSDKEGVRLPHVGWNTLDVTDPADPVIGSLSQRDVYFVHSFAMKVSDEYILAKTRYGADFVSAVRRERMYGVQFHPEKSSELGKQLLTGFMSLG